MKQLQRRFILLFVSLAFVFFTFFTFLVLQTFGNQYDQMHRDQMEDQLYFLSSQMERVLTNNEAEDAEESIKILEKSLDQSNLRVTIIAEDGSVLYDSEANPAQMENHGDRPEFIEAKQTQGTAFSKRESRTTGERYLYAARWIDNGITPPIVLRLADPSVFRDSMVRVFLVTAVAFIAFSLIIIAFVTHNLSQNLFQPLEEIKEVAERVARQDFSLSYTGQSYVEVQELGASINELSDNLENQLYELKQSNNRLNSLLENINIGVALLDEDRQIELVNPAMNHILQTAMSSQGQEKYIYYIKNPWIVELIEDAYQTQETQSREIIIQGNEERVLDATVIPIESESGELNNIILLLYDITEIRRLEKVRTDFVANASHELRTPVTALKGFTETLLQGAMDDREVLVEFLEIMYKESDRLDSIVRDILQLSRLENQPFSIKEEEVVVSDVVEEVFQIVEQTAERKEIRLVKNDPEQVTFCYDWDLLKQILLNLVNNALLYTNSGGQVQVDVSQDKDQVKIQVKDNGMGIPEKDQNRIFERFYRVDKGRSRNSGGTGLGLSIVKHLVENSRGSIEVQSKYGIGSNFIVRLPLESHRANGGD